MEVHFDEKSAIVQIFSNGEDISRPFKAILKKFLRSNSANVRICGVGEEVTRNCSDVSSSWLEKFDGFNNPAIQSLSCDFEGYSLRKMRKLKKFLRSFNSNISMVHLELKGSRDRQFIKLLDCLDEKKLRKLTLSSTEATVNNNNNILNLDELTNTVQWKHAIELVAEQTLISVSPEKCCHFLKVNAAFAKVDTNDVDFFVKVVCQSNSKT